MDTPGNELRQDQAAPEPLKKPIGIGAAFREWLEKQEKEAYAEWIGRLSPEELKSYETMGFQFQLVKAICQNPEMIALSADEREDKKAGEDDDEKDRGKIGESRSERFSFSEVAQIVKDLERMAQKFLGRELERKPNALFDQFITAYNTLRAFLAQQERVGFVEEQEHLTVTITPYFDQELFEIIETAMPPDMLTLIKSGEVPHGTNGGVEREEVRQAYSRMVRSLQLNDEEKEQFKQALRVIVKVRRKILDNREDTSKGLKRQLEVDDLREIVESMGSLECLRRVYGTNTNSGILGLEKMFGLNEIHRLVQFIRSWEGTFRWLSKMKMGRMVPETEAIEEIGEKSPEDYEKRLEEEREKRRLIIKNFTDAFNLIFPDPLAPMIMKRHREVLRRRIQNYKVLAQYVNGIGDEKLKRDLKEILFMISTILSYLDYMWNMHEVEENGAGKHIVYPKKMLLLGPLIIQEVEELAGKLNLLSEQYRGAFADTEGEFDDLFDMEHKPAEDEQKPVEEQKPRGLGIRYEDSSAFRFGPDTIVSITHDNALAAADVQTPEDKKHQELKTKLSNCMGMIAFTLMVNISGARRNLGAARVKNVMVNEEKPANGEKMTQTLSYDIHDFINDLRDPFYTLLYEIAKVFDDRVTKKEVLPELEAHEDQAARLRYQMYALGARIKPSAEVMAFAMIADPKQLADEIVPGLQAVFTNLTDDINTFQSYQEQNLNDKKYHEVLRGAGYEKLVRLANALNDFDENHNGQLEVRTVELFVLRKRLDEFAEKLQMSSSKGELPHNGVLGAWLKDLMMLKKVEDRILANGISPEAMGKLQEQYVERFMHVLNTMYDISTKDELVHSVPDQNNVETYKVPAAVKERFGTFLETNPLAEQCQTTDFTQCFHKFYKLIHLMGDFTQVCDLQMNPNTPEQEFLKEFDMRKAETFARECKTLLEADYASTDRIQKNKLLLSLAASREALGHLMFRAPERAEILDIILNDMENTIRVRYEQGKPIHPDDLETFYFQFLREIEEQPITVQ